MAVTLNIPPEIAELLQEKSALPLERQALEAAAVEWYRQGYLLHSQFAKLLGLSRYDADGVLKHHGVLHEMSARELDEDLQAATRSGRR